MLTVFALWCTLFKYICQVKIHIQIHIRMESREYYSTYSVLMLQSHPTMIKQMSWAIIFHRYLPKKQKTYMIPPKLPIGSPALTLLISVLIPITS